MKCTKFKYEISVYENRGRDVLPFLSVLQNINLDSYPFILKLHTKELLHREDGDKWCRDICSCLARPKQLDWILRQMCSAPSIGLVGPQDHVISMGTYFGENRENVRWLASRMGIENVDPVRDSLLPARCLLHVAMRYGRSSVSHWVPTTSSRNYPRSMGRWPTR